MRRTHAGFTPQFGNRAVRRAVEPNTTVDQRSALPGFEYLSECPGPWSATGCLIVFSNNRFSFADLF